MSEILLARLAIAFAAFVMAVSSPLIVSPAAAASLNSVSAMKTGASVDVRIHFDGAFEAPQSFALASPDRLVIDLPGGAAGGTTYPGAGEIRQIRTAQFDNHKARIVLDLNAPMSIGKSEVDGQTLTIRLQPMEASAFAALARKGRKTLKGSRQIEVAAASPPTNAVRTSATPTPIGTAATAAATKTAAKAARTRHAPPQRSHTGLPVVVIDAGHGGRDPGSPSIDGKREKDAVLAIAKAIKKELDASGRVRTILTRDDDRYIPHRARTDVARHNGAQLFMSIHADSFPQNPEVSGATIYTLSETASDKEAARLASRENRSDLIAGVDMTAENDDVTSILIDLAQRETMNSSAQFAALLQREMVGAGVPFRSHFHRFAGFLVLKAPDVPAILLETGYMSNEKDAKYLFSRAGQEEIAKGVRRAVEAHFLRRLAQR